MSEVEVKWRCVSNVKTQADAAYAAGELERLLLSLVEAVIVHRDWPTASTAVSLEDALNAAKAGLEEKHYLPAGDR